LKYPENLVFDTKLLCVKGIILQVCAMCIVQKRHHFGLFEEVATSKKLRRFQSFNQLRIFRYYWL